MASLAVLSACAAPASTPTQRLNQTFPTTASPPVTQETPLPPERATSPLRDGIPTPIREIIEAPSSADDAATPGENNSSAIDRLADPGSFIVLAGHADAVVSAEFSPDGTRIVTASADRTAITWDARTGTQLALLRGHSKGLTAAHFDGAGTRVVTASYDGTARIWEAASGQQVFTLLGHQDIVNDVRFGPAGQRVVTASEDGTARVWDTQSGALQLLLDGECGPVNSAIFSPDGSRVATGADDGALRIWDAVDGRLLFLLPEAVPEGRHSNLAVRAIRFSPNGSRVLAAGQDGHVTVWDASTGASLLDIQAHGRGITLADLSPNGDRIASASFFAGVASVWDAATGSELATLHHGSIIQDVAFDASGARVATAGSDYAARLWDAASGERLTVLTGHTGIVRTVQFSPSGEELVTASADGTARVWNVTTAAPLEGVDAGNGPPSGLSPDGPWRIFAGADGLWAVNRDGTGATQISTGDFGGYGVDPTGWAAPRGGRIAYITTQDAYYSATLHVTRLPHGRDEALVQLTVDETEPSRDALPGDPALDAVSVAIQDDSFAWSPDGRWLAFTGMLQGPTSDLYVYGASSGDVTRLTDGPTQASRPVWSPDGRYILHAGLEGAHVDTGMHARAFWVAARDGSGTTLVQEGEQQFVGWADTDRMLFYTINTLCGAHDLRAVDLEGGRQPIWEGAFDRVAYEPESGAVLVAVWSNSATSEGCQPNPGQGLFLTDAAGAAPTRVVEDEVREIVWSPEAHLFFGRTDRGILAVSASGEFIDLAVPESSFGFPRVAARTGDLAWGGAGLWISSLNSGIDRPPRQIAPDRTRLVGWTPDGSDLQFVTADGSLYVAGPPEFQPTFTAPLGTVSSAVWVTP